MHDKTWRLSTRLIACAAVACVCAALAATANAASPRSECPPNVANCTTVTGASLTVTSGARRLLTWVACPASQRSVGYSYSGGDNTSEAQTIVSVIVFPNYPNTQFSWTGVPNAGRTIFFTISENALPNHTVMVQPRIGCVPAGSMPTPSQPQCPPAVANCTTVDSAWVAAGPADGSLAEVRCPSGDWPVGFSYAGGNGPDTAVAIQIYPGCPNTWHVFASTDSKGLVFFRVLGSPPSILGTSSFSPSSVQLSLGCTPAPATGTRPGNVRASQRIRTFTVRLAPASVRTYTHGCRAGTRLLRGQATVEFRSPRRPSRSELTAVKLRATRRGSRESWRVTTSGGLRHKGAVLTMFLFHSAR